MLKIIEMAFFFFALSAWLNISRVAMENLSDDGHMTGKCLVRKLKCVTRGIKRNSRDDNEG